MLTRFQELSLIARCVAADDRHSFGLLVEAYSDPLRRFLLGLTHGDTPLADDLAQDTFLKAYLSIRSLEAVSRFRTWLFRIAYNEFLTHLRHQHPMASLSEIAETEPPDDTGPPAVDDGDNAATAIGRMLATLPAPQRAVVQLFYYEDFSIARISAVTGLPQGTVKSYLSRAGRRLATLLEKYR